MLSIWRKALIFFIAVALSTAAAHAQVPAVLPQPAMVPAPRLEPQTFVAQSQRTQAELLPIDLTPIKIPERASFFDTFKAEALYRLPGRMFFNATCENSVRIETNILQTLKHNRADGIYRVLPNVTLGYALTRRTRVSANYFYLRDTYMTHGSLSRNIHSVGFRIDQDFPLTERTTMSAGFFGRELFITHQANRTDLLPSVVFTRRMGNRGIIYASILGQVRWRGLFEEWQEFDQFYSFGGVYRTTNWIYSLDTTLVSNFGKRRVRGGPDNQIIILTLEAGRQIHPRLPLTVFVRTEPIFDMGASQAQGFAGVNVRVFGGIRMELSKPAVFPVALRH